MKGGSALLRRQILLITMLVALVATVLIALNISQLITTHIADTRAKAETIALQAATAAEAAVVAAPDQPPQRAISESHLARVFGEAAIRRGAPVISLVIEDEAGNPLLQAPKDAYAHQYPPFSALSDASLPTRLKRLFERSEQVYEYSRVLAYKDQSFGRVRLGVAFDEARREILRVIVINLLIALAAIAAAMFIAISSARLIAAPLKAISSSIEEIGHGDEMTAPVLPQRLTRNADFATVADRLAQLRQQIDGNRSELRETRGRLQQILSNLQERLLLLNTDGRIMLASPGVENLLNAHQIADGRLLVEAVGADHPLVALTERALLSREFVERVTLPATNGHGARPVVVSVQPIVDLGQTVGALVILRDRETVDQLALQLDYSERLIDYTRITSGIAHEVKNPLNAMVIHLELLRAKLDRIAPHADDARPQLDILTSEIQRLDRVVQTFLDFTRPPRISLRPLDLNKVLDETIILAAPEAVALGSTVERSFDPDLPPIAGDADMLKQAFLNIIINGFQAMTDGGVLEVSTARNGERTVRVSITDHGVGIAPQARERIFQLYYTTKPNGNGIGLAQAFRAVQLHYGRISFESQPNIGTTFHVEFPAA
jgi:signal transduction histidine kinase